jgi:hypothetical protein
MFFLVPKKDGGQTPVINLKNLNVFLRYEYFKMEGLGILSTESNKHLSDLSSPTNRPSEEDLLTNESLPF